MIDAATLQQPMVPDTEYFDATASILELGSRVALLEQAIGQQHEIIKKLVELVKGDKPSALILPERFN